MSTISALAKKGLSIVVARSVPEPDRLAARELADHLAAMTARSPAPVRLLVGDGAIAAAHPAALAPLEEDEVEIRKIGASDLAIRGGGPRGTLYAAYELLEHLGMRWFHPEETVIPKVATLNLPDLIRRKPSFEYRETLWRGPCSDPGFAARLRFNGLLNAVPAKWGGHWGWQPFVHTFFTAIPPADYARSHPEYYSFRKGQGRVVHGGQLCLSNPDVLDLLTAFALNKMADPMVRIVDLSQMDSANPCECPACAARDRKAGSPAGSLLAMCNEVAARTSRRYPDKCIGTLAYTYTLRPPRGMKAHPNVIVRLCHMHGCETHPLDGCAHNREFLRTLDAWKKVAGRIYIWDYDTNFQHILFFHPNFNAVRNDIRLFRNQGVRGLFLQGYAATGVAFNELHAYAMGRCLWNADLDYFTEARAFLDGYYGEAAAPHLWKMIRRLQKHNNPDFHLTLYTHPHQGTFTPAQLRAAQADLEKAIESAKGDARRTRRLEQVAVWMAFSRLASARPIEKRAACLRIHAACADAPACFATVRKGLKRFGIARINEYPESMNDMKVAWGWSLRDRDLPLTVIENDRVRAELSPELNGVICTLLDKRSGIDLLCKPEPAILSYPYMTGLIEGLSLEKGTAGFREFDRWRLKAVDAGRTVMSIALEGGLEVERTVSVLPNEAGIRVRSAITNRSKEARKIRPHSFLLLRAGALDDIHFYKRAPDGKLVNLRNGMRAGAEQEQWVNLSGAAVPDRWWGFYNPKLRIGLSEEADRAFEFCGSNGHLSTGHVLTEARLAPIAMKPGATVASERIFRIWRNKT